MTVKTSKEALARKDVGILYEGTEIKLPALPKPMKIKEAREWLYKLEQEEEKIVDIVEEVQGYPLDAIHAIGLAVKKLYGFTEKVHTEVATMFGTKLAPPRYINVPIDYTGKSVEVFVGSFAIPGIEGLFKTQGSAKGVNLVANVKQKYRPQVQALVKTAREMLVTNSLYRGKAVKLSYSENGFTGAMEVDPPEFIPPYTGVEPRLNPDLTDNIEATVFGPVRYTEAARAARVKLRRGVLLYGPYGTGKSLIMRKLADCCEENNWTFLYCKTPECLMDAFDFARILGSKTVIACEDFDIIIKKNDQNALQNLLDGVDTKNLEIILVLTTNHPEEIPPALMRDGRIDAAIPFVPPDAPTVIQLIKDFAGPKLAPKQDLTAVGKALEGRIPAIIHGVVETATLHALRLTNGKDPSLTSEAILAAANSKEAHIKMIERSVPKKTSLLEEAGEILGRHLAMGIIRANGIDYDGENPWPAEATLEDGDFTAAVRLATEKRPAANGKR